MQKELKTAGRDVAMVAINIIAAESTQADLASQGEYPMFQDVAEVNAWARHGGVKDDLYVYGSDGKLVRYLAYGGDVDTNLSDATAYEVVKKIVTDAK